MGRLNFALMIERLEQLRGGTMRSWVFPSRRDFGDGKKDKGALCNSRMRQNQGLRRWQRRCDGDAIPINDIEIERAWPPAPAAPASRCLLDGMQAMEQ